MALTLRWVQTWDGSDLAWSQTWGDSGVFVLNAQAPIALVGQMGVAGDIAIETPTTFQLQAQAPIALAGVLGVSGDLTIRSPWELLAPLQLGAMVGVLGISGDLVFSSPSTFQLQPVAPIALLGALDIAGDIEIATAVVFELSAIAPIALAGSLGIQGDLVFERTFSLEPVAAIALSGQLGISGDLVIAQAVLFELQAQAPVTLVGLLGIQAEIESTVPFDLVAGAPIALQGVLGIAAAPVFGSRFELVAEQPLALTGTLGVSGDIELVIPATVPDVVGLTQAAAIAALEAARFVVVVVTATSDTIAAGQVISQAPSAGTESTVGSIVTITVSSGQGAATDPRLIARGRRRSKYPNISVKGLRRRKDDDEPEAAVAPATPSGLLLGLLARGLTAPVPPAGTPEPAPSLDDAIIAEVLVAEPAPSEPEEKPEAEAAEVESPSAIALLEELRADVKALRAELAQMRSGAPAAPDLPPLRDPIADALQAIIPALREPVDLTDPPPASPKAPTMTKDEIDRENERRIAAAVKRLL